MRKKLCFTLDTEQDKALVDMLEEIPACLRGPFIKIAIMMDMDPDKDKDIFEKYPDFLKNPMRFEIVKDLLKSAGTDKATVGCNMTGKEDEKRGDGKIALLPLAAFVFPQIEPPRKKQTDNQEEKNDERR